MVAVPLRQIMARGALEEARRYDGAYWQLLCQQGPAGGKQFAIIKVIATVMKVVKPSKARVYLSCGIRQISGGFVVDDGMDQCQSFPDGGS